MGAKHHPSRLGGSAPVETVVVPALELAAGRHRPRNWWLTEGEYGGVRATPDAICRAYAGRVPATVIARLLGCSRVTVGDYCRERGYGQAAQSSGVTLHQAQAPDTRQG